MKHLKNNFLERAEVHLTIHPIVILTGKIAKRRKEASKIPKI